MMKKHPLPIDTPTDLIDTPSLPDRSELSKLYPDAKKSAAASEPKISIVDREHLAKTVRESAVKIGLLLPLPFIIGMVPALLFMQHTTFNNIFQLLPLMTLTMIAWGIAVVGMFTKVANYLNRLSITPFTFLCLLISCLLLVTPPTYYIAQLLANEWLGQALFSVALLALNVGFSWLFLQLVLNDRLTDKTKLKLIGLVITICLISVAGYLFVDLA